MRLIDVVSKRSNLECGTFGNISDDLGAIEELLNQPPMIQMAYAYARRTVAAGLFLQGVFTYDAFQHACTIFKSLQVTTGHSVDFQEEAYDQAIELLTDYDYRLNKNFSSLITTMAISNDLGVNQYPRRTYEDTIESIQYLSSRKQSSSSNEPRDQYEVNAEIIKLSIMASMLEKEGKKAEAAYLRLQIEKLKNDIYAENMATYYHYKGSTDTETENNIFNAIQPLIRNNSEYVQFVFEELDAASQGNDYSKNFAKNCGIDPKYYKGALSGTSSIDRAGGPQQFLANSINTIYGGPDNGVPHRINVVKKFIAKGLENGILSEYATGKLGAQSTKFTNIKSIYKGSLTIDSLAKAKRLNVVVMAIVKNGKLIYCNNYDNNILESDGDGSDKFRGPIYKIQLSLTTGDNFDIFYGIVTGDRISMTMSLGNAAIDENCVYILKELEQKCSGIFNLDHYDNAPTRFSYHLYLYPQYIYATNNSGNDAYFIALDGSRYENGSKDEILNLMSNYVPKNTSQTKEQESKQQFSNSVSVKNESNNKTKEDKSYLIFFSFIIIIVIFTIGVVNVSDIFNFENKENKEDFVHQDYNSDTYSTSNNNNGYSSSNNSVTKKENSTYSTNLNNTSTSSTSTSTSYQNTQTKSYASMSILDLLGEVDKVGQDKSLSDYSKYHTMQQIYDLVVSKLKRELYSEDINLLNKVISSTNEQVLKIKDFCRSANFTESSTTSFLGAFYYFKIRELAYISSSVDWESELPYCKDTKQCTSHELSRISSAFADKYNNLREVCQAGYCNEEILKEQERIWIEYSAKTSTLIDKNSKTNNLNMLKICLTTNQDFLLKSLHNMFIEKLVKEQTPFNFDSYKTLFDSLIVIQDQLKQNRFTEYNLKKLNAHLSTYLLPYLYLQLNEKGINTDNLEISAGAYDLTYRMFLVSSNKHYFGDTYDRNETEIAKVDGKINRAKHLLYLLLPDYNITYINANTAGFSCYSTPCSNQDFLRNGRYLEEIYGKLTKQCKQKKCITANLFKQENNWVAYTKEWLKLLDKAKSRDDIKNHIKVLYDNDNINRLSKALDTYQ